MQVTAKLVKELRGKTGAGMMDCKKALVETEGNIELAVDWLREKGIAKAAKKASRIAAEGSCVVKTNGNKAIIFELNSETDFVAKNENFVNLTNKIAAALLASDATCEECALEVPVGGTTLKEFLLESISSIGENLTFRRFEVVLKEDHQEFGAYMHMGGKIAALTVLDNADFETAKDIAMHVAASSPQYLSSKDISEEFIVHETDVLTREALNENAEAVKPKPEGIIKKMVMGRLNKSFKAMCLLSQPFIKDPNQSVEQYVNSKGSKVQSFKRLAVGEGIEKKVENFAEEVMNQTR
ncbi:MAG: elongation factor Ts [Tenericutes bacterium]|nr:elongation factor Ts [Mycoplasmatota bacterium]